MHKIFLAMLSYLLFLSQGHATITVECAYGSMTKKEMTNEKYCGVINSKGYLVLHHQIIAKIDWSKYGMQCIFVQDLANEISGWYFVGQEGRGLPASFGWDNDCTGFTEGLARGQLAGKVVFYDRNFKIKFNTNYLWSSGFVDGFAKVCKGALKKYYPRIPGTLRRDEYHSYKGGQCGFIDKNGKEVVPLVKPYEQLRQEDWPKTGRPGKGK